MVRVRASKVEKVADEIPPPEVFGDGAGEALVVGWGSTFGSIREAVIRLRRDGHKVGHMHLRWLNPLPPGVGEILERYDRVIVPELNLGQLVRVLRERFLVDAIPISKVQGQPFKAQQLTERIRSLLGAE
jgi:2-oxoglutarate ferredoxin oxidoreductase subunit alpha